MIRFLFVALLHIAAAAHSLGAESDVLQGSVENLSSDAWEISGFDSTFELTAAGLSGEFRIARIAFAESGRTFEDIRVACVLISLTTRSVNCVDGTFAATIPGVGRQTIPGAFSYDRYTSTANIELSGVAIAGGRARFNVTASEAGLAVRYTATGLQLGELSELASKFNESFSQYSATGLVDVSGTINAPAKGSLRIDVEADLNGASLANDAGTIAADGIKGKLDLDIEFDPNTTKFGLTFTSNQGEAYLEPAYANFSEHAFRLKAEDIITPDFVTFDVGRFSLQQASLLDLDGSARLSFPTEEGASTAITADVELRDSSVANLYTSLIQIKLAGTVLGDLDTDGRVSGSVRIDNNSLSSAVLQLNDLILDDRSGRFAIYELNGALDWNADENQVPAVSQFHWASGTAYSIAIGGGEMRIQLGDNDIELLTPLRLPTMGGALLINQFALHDFGTEDATGRLDAELEPVQLGQLTGAFGWPAFSGTLSGRLPLLQLADNIITVGGTLSARAFDGTMEMSKLRIERPFGLVPRMQGEIAFRDLDLQRVTEAFSFGLIQGRLSGDIAELEMQNWRPVAMDMHFYTPSDDKSLHRISQRAVENLASVGGGGAAAVLSTGFLRFFEVFAYDRIGLRCLLENGACAMSGAGPAKTGQQGRGYYIVKGRGIPRIDVVGYRDTVSWPGLVAQLTAISRSGSPTVN